MVRVVAGTAGGLKLKTPDSDKTKPTLDRVKEPMFSILGPYIYGRTVLDLFAGCGALGIEALSRGADYCFFNDFDRNCAAVIKENLRHTSLSEKAGIICLPYRKALSQLRLEGKRFGLVLLDPPYETNCYEDVLLTALDYGLLEPDCAIMCEHGRENVLPDTVGTLSALKRRGYGTVGLTLYRAETT